MDHADRSTANEREIEHVRELLEERARRVDGALKSLEHRVTIEDKAIRDRYDAILSGIRTATAMATEEREKAAAALRDQLSDRIQAGDTNLREHIQAQIGQLKQMVDSSVLLSDTRFRASQEAIQKAEVATEKRFESTNEWRAQSLDRERTMQESTAKFAPRELVDSQTSTVNARLTRMESFQAKLTGGLMVVAALGVANFVQTWFNR